MEYIEEKMGRSTLKYSTSPVEINDLPEALKESIQRRTNNRLDSRDDLRPLKMKLITVHESDSNRFPGEHKILKFEETGIQDSYWEAMGLENPDAPLDIYLVDSDVAFGKNLDIDYLQSFFFYGGGRPLKSELEKIGLSLTSATRDDEQGKKVRLNEDISEMTKNAGVDRIVILLGHGGNEDDNVAQGNRERAMGTLHGEAILANEVLTIVSDNCKKTDKLLVINGTCADDSDITIPISLLQFENFTYIESRGDTGIEAEPAINVEWDINEGMSILMYEQAAGQV